MYLWNETLEYDNRTWSIDSIKNWASNHVHRVALWMTPSGFKSISLSHYFKDGPVLLFFTPRNLIKQSTDAMEMMRQIGMEYYNCHGDEWIREMVREYLPTQRQDHVDQLKALQRHCQDYTTTMKSSHRKPISITFVNLMNGSSQLNVNDRIEDICQVEPDSIFTKQVVDRIAPTGQCEKESCGAESRQSASLKWRECSMVTNTLDRKAPLHLQKMAKRRLCELLAIDSANSVHSFLGTKSFDVDMLQGIEGLGCKSGNSSLTLLLMDSSIFHVFAERLGLDILNTKKNSGVIIVDPKVIKLFIYD